MRVLVSLLLPVMVTAGAHAAGPGAVRGVAPGMTLEQAFAAFPALRQACEGRTKTVCGFDLAADVQERFMGEPMTRFRIGIDAQGRVDSTQVTFAKEARPRLEQAITDSLGKPARRDPDGTTYWVGARNMMRSLQPQGTTGVLLFTTTDKRARERVDYLPVEK